MEEVIKRIEKIRSIFIDTELFCATNDSIPSVLQKLEEIPPEFRSIGFESASMAIALKGFQLNNNIDEWKLFANGPARAHEAQVYIGLGWAIAKLNLPFLSVVEPLEPLLFYRVADGCGYYDGSFRQRQTLINQQLPAYLPVAALPMYLQGVGRSLWYSCNTDIDKVKNRINAFPAASHAALWRGLGIAVAYIGGCDDETIKNIFDHAGEHGEQLAWGGALAARSRTEANSMITDTDRCSRLWFKFITEQNSSSYNEWIRQVEKDLAKSFTLG